MSNKTSIGVLQLSHETTPRLNDTDLSLVVGQPLGDGSLMRVTNYAWARPLTPLANSRAGEIRPDADNRLFKGLKLC